MILQGHKQVGATATQHQQEHKTGPCAIPIESGGYSNDPLGGSSVARDARVRACRNAGNSMRAVARITGVPLATVGDICKRERDAVTETMPFYRLIDF